MAYNEQPWRDTPAGGTPLSAERLSNIEAGIGGAHIAIDTALRDIESAIGELKAGLTTKVNDASTFIPASAFVGGGTLTKVPGTDVPALSFADAANVSVSTMLDLPDDWPTNPAIHILWTPSDATAGNAAWRAGVQSYDAETVLGSAAYSAEVVQAAGGVAGKVRALPVGSLNVDAARVTNLVVESRAAETTDTYVGTRYLLGVRMWKTVQVLPADPTAPPPAADIATTVLTATMDNVNRSSYVSASVAPAANRLLLLAVLTGSTDGTTGPLGTPTGLGLTWTKQADEPFSQAAGIRRLTVWSAQTGGTAPTPGSITVDLGGILSVAGGIGLVQVENAHGTSPIVQPKSAEGVMSTPAKVTMAAPLNSKSRLFTFYAWRVNESAVPPAGYTELWDLPTSSPSIGFVGAWLPSGFDTAPSLPITKEDWAAIGVEIRAAAEATPAPDDGGGTGGFAELEQNDGGPRTADLYLRAEKITPTGLYTTIWRDPVPPANRTYDLRQFRGRGFFWADPVFGFGTYSDGSGGTTATSHELNFTPVIIGKDAAATGAALIGGIVEGDQNPNLTWNSMKHGSHIQDCLDGGGSGDSCWSLINNNQNMDGDPRVYIAADSFAVIAGLRTRHTMDGFGVYGPEGSDTRLGNGTAYFRNCWFSDVHDDGIENDRQRKVKITDCLFEKVYTFLSTRAPDESGTPQTSKTQEVRDSIVWLHPRPGPYKQPTSSVKHDLIYKMQTNSPGLSMRNVVIGASAPRGSSSLQLPTRADLDSYENVTIVWMGGGTYPGNVPPGVTVTTDASVLTNAVADWKRRHGVTDFETVNMDKMLSPEAPAGTVAPTPTPVLLALPGLIDGVEPEAHSHIPVFGDVNSNLYRITEEYASVAGHNQPRMMKSTDGGVNWSEMDKAGRPTNNDLEGGWAIQSPGLVHFCWTDGGVMTYCAFATSDHPTVADRDTWIVQREDFSSGMSAGSQQYASMVRTSDGKIWFFFSDTLSGSNKQIAYARRNGLASYSAKTKIGTTADSFACPVSVLGAGDLTHLFYKDMIGRTVQYRTLTAAGVLSGATRADTSGTHTRANALTNCVYYDAAGVSVTTVAFATASGTDLRSVSIHDGVVQAEQVIATGPAVDPGTSGNDGVVAHLAVRDTTLYAIWAQASTGDVLYATRLHGGAWSAATRLWDSGSNEAWWVYNSIVSHAGDPYMYYTYDQAPHADDDSNIYVNRIAVS